MISIPGTLFFVMSSNPAKKTVGDARYMTQELSIHFCNQCCPYKYPNLHQECVLPTSNAIRSQQNVEKERSQCLVLGKGTTTMCISR